MRWCRDGTVHTSTKACPTSVAMLICDPDHHQNLIICSLAHCQRSVKMSCKSVQKFLHKVANRQTNNGDYISSLVEVKIIHFSAVLLCISWCLTACSHYCLQYVVFL